MDIPADADGGDPASLDDLLSAGPSILDEMLARTQPEQARAAQLLDVAARGRVPQRSYRAPLSRQQRPQFGPGSMTRPLGVNEQVVGANDFGDGRGNVLRDNMRHFGFSGTRAR